MHILLVSSMYPKPGRQSTNFIHRSVIELAKSDINIKVVCPTPRLVRYTSGILTKIRDQNITLELDGIQVSYIPYLNFPLKILPKLDVASQYFFLKKWLLSDGRSEKFDIVHANRLFPTGSAALKVARFLDVPFLCSARGSEVHTYPHRNKRIKTLTQKVILQSNQISAVSKNLAYEVELLATPNKPVVVVYNGVDTDVFYPRKNQDEIRKRLGVPKHGLGIGSVCRLMSEKGVLELLSAFHVIAQQREDVWLCFVGDGPLFAKIQEKIIEFGLVGRVYMPGFCLHHEVATWLNAIDIFVLASYDEGLPNVVLEAMACGKPVIATDTGGTSELVFVDSTGLLVPPRSSEALTGALKRLLEEPEFRSNLAKNGYSLVSESFSWSRHASKQMSLYKELLVNWKSV